MAEEEGAAIAKATDREVAGEKVSDTNASVTAVPTVREMFSLPVKEADPGDDNWQAFKEKISEEVKGVKFTAAMPDLAQKICELLDISLPNIFVAAWKKAGELLAVLEKSCANPDDVTYLELAEHVLNSQHKPSVDVRLKGATIKKIQLEVLLGFKLRGFVLKIQNGAIREMQTGNCEAQGAIKYGGLPIAEKKLAPIRLPFSIPIKPAGEPDSAEPPAPTTEEKKPEDSSELERIEL